MIHYDSIFQQKMILKVSIEQQNLSSMRNIACQSGVDEKTIWKLKSNKDKICERAKKVDQVIHESTFVHLMEHFFNSNGDYSSGLKLLVVCHLH